uniref:Uncharacterized protein n=1 Tax=Oryza punctata TaxID=4537 RepID=A0A0E0JQ22_ORYPU
MRDWGKRRWRRAEVRRPHRAAEAGMGGGTCLRDGLREYTSNALISGGSSELAFLRRVKLAPFLRKNRLLLYVLSTRNGCGL